jgi:hypothetical protein
MKFLGQRAPLFRCVANMRVSGVLNCGVRTSGFRLALVRIELLLNDSLRPRLLAGWLMLGVELCLAEFTDSDDGNIFDSLYYPKTALGHEHSFPQFGPEGRISAAPLAILRLGSGWQWRDPGKYCGIDGLSS